MLHPIMTDAKVPDTIGNTVFAWILVIGGITVLYYVIWLLICRGPGCRRYPNHPVWLQQLMDRDYFAIDLMAAVIFFSCLLFHSHISYGYHLPLASKNRTGRIS